MVCLNIGMLAVSPLRNTYRDGKQEEAVETNNINFSSSINGGDGFPDFADSNLLDSIDFDDLFISINVDGDILPDLEMDPEILADFSAEDYNSDVNTTVSAEKSADIDDNVGNSNEGSQDKKPTKVEVEEDKVSGSGSGLDSSPPASVARNGVSSTTNMKEAADKGGGGRKSSSTTAQSKNNHNNNNSQGKRKVKVSN